jgi:GNAT superfamily N-acetyltransferase
MEDLRISNDIGEFDFDLIHRYLCNESYWAKGVAMEKVRKSFANSTAFGGFLGATQVAFGRVVTDLSTFGYLRDIVVLPAYRGKGYGKAMVEAIIGRLKDEGVPAMMLGTADAHDLYRKYGFNLVGDTPNLMVWRKPADIAPGQD